MPKNTMAITRAKKEEIVQKAKNIFGTAKTVAFVNFKGLTVAEVSELRKALKAQEVGYTVAKKNLLRRALKDAKVAGDEPALEGEIALAYGSDELAPAREVAPFVKKFQGHLAFAGGIFEGKFVSKEEITSIAAIPGMETLRAMFAQIINSPRSRLAIALGQVAQKK